MKKYIVEGILENCQDETVIYLETDDLNEANIAKNILQKAIRMGRLSSYFDGRYDNVTDIIIIHNTEE